MTTTTPGDDLTGGPPMDTERPSTQPPAAAAPRPIPLTAFLAALALVFLGLYACSQLNRPVNVRVDCTYSDTYAQCHTSNGP